MPACSQPDPRKPQDLEREKPFLSEKEREVLAKARAETFKGLPEETRSPGRRRQAAS